MRKNKLRKPKADNYADVAKKNPCSKGTGIFVISFYRRITNPDYWAAGLDYF